MRFLKVIGLVFALWGAGSALSAQNSVVRDTACNRYTWYDSTYTQSGTYRHIIYNMAGGNDTSTLYLQLYYDTTTSFTAQACEKYVWGNNVYTASGIYEQQFQTVHGCDSLAVLDLTILQKDSIVNSWETCDHYVWRGHTYTESGTYHENYTNRYGCDSTYVLHLIIHKSVHDTIPVAACDQYTWRGQNYTASGCYTREYQTQQGCDSTITLQLQLFHSATATIDTSACESITLYGTTYTESCTHQQHLLTTHNCDSLVTLNVQIYPVYRDTLVAEACEQYTWRDSVYSRSGFYQKKSTTLHGCDSISFLRLVIYQETHDTLTRHACNNFEWQGTTYNETGLYTHADTSRHGCDSTVTLKLFIHHDGADTVTASECESYEWQGETYTRSGTYHDTVTTEYGCDSMLTLQLTIYGVTDDTLNVSANNYYVLNGDTITESGTYTQSLTSSNGCDSTVTLDITINDLTSHDTITGCDEVVWQGITYNTDTMIVQSVNDSLIYTYIQVNHTSNDTITASGYEQYEWNGVTYTQSGTYTQSFSTSEGCDSSVTMILNLSSYPHCIYIEEGGMTLCNNIIANNPNTRVDNLVGLEYNIITDGTVPFHDADFDYRPELNFTEAVNKGNNACVDFARDLADMPRILADTVDIGAYEVMPLARDTVIPTVVFFDEEGTLTLCNNIITHNPNTRIDNLDTTLAYNIITSDYVFFHDVDFDYRPELNFTEAINKGNNDCVDFARDIADMPRILADTVDLGAYEIMPLARDTVVPTVVSFEEDGTLTLCNNIITHNPNTRINNLDTTLAYNIITSDYVFFHDVDFDYRPELNFTEAINKGNNDCVDFARDLADMPRILADTVDLGAYEIMPLARDTVVPTVVSFEEDGTLTLCNNIITHNPNTRINNLDTTLAYNIITSDYVFFHDVDFDYRPELNFTEAINKGNNDCVDFARDLADMPRILADTVDLGAYEIMPLARDTVVPTVVSFEEEGTLTLCNNIITHNPNTRIDNLDTTLAYNIITSDYVFFHDVDFDYRPELNFTEAINKGNNACVDFARDIADMPRILGDTVDLGAYEIMPLTKDSSSVVYEEAEGGLQMYNTIVVNNRGAYTPCVMTVIPTNNLVADTANVFIDSLRNYNLIAGCIAENTGDNQYAVSIIKDIKADERIACGGIVDKGAYEVQHDPPVVSFTANYLSVEGCNSSLVALTASGGDTYYWAHNGSTDSTVIIDAYTQNTYSVTAYTDAGCATPGTYTFVPEANPFDQSNLPSTYGKEFWVSFMKNFIGTSTLTLIASSDSACTGTVLNPNTGWTTTFTVPANGMTNISIPAEQGYCETSEETSNLGLIIATDKSISLYASNFQNFSYDVSNILPTSSLGRNYIVQSYSPMIASEFLVVATEDETEVEITPAAKTAGGRLAHIPFTITLQRGQVYQVLSYSGGSAGDMSGSTVKVLTIGRKVAVFNGNACASVSVGTSYCDHLFEQAFATRYWGHTFAIATAEQTSYNMVKVMASRNQTEVKVDGVPVATIQSGQSYEFALTAAQGTCFIETSLPAAVFLYLNGALANENHFGDPSMTWIAPLEQSIRDIIFGTFNSPQIRHHYVNVVTATDNINTVTLDGVSIAGDFVPLPSNPDYAYVRKEIQHGMHALQSNGTFTAYVYGLGINESYAYSAGSRMQPATQRMLINEVESTIAATTFCVYDPIDFEADISYQYDSLTWNFNDGTFLRNIDSVNHYFTEAGSYPVDLIIYDSQDGMVNCFLIRAMLNIKGNSVQTIDTVLCVGDVYQDDNFNVAASEPGYYTYQQSFNYEDTTLTCDSLIVLRMNVYAERIVVKDTICLGESYTVGSFNVTPTAEGLYVDSVSYDAHSRCDSLVVLQLWVSGSLPDTLSIHGPRDVCIESSYTYSVPPMFNQYSWHLPTGAQCLEETHADSILLYFNELMQTDSLSVTVQNSCGTRTYAIEIIPHNNYYQLIEDTVCERSVYDRHGFYIDTVTIGEGSFVHNEVSRYGCDSTTVLNLYIYPLPDTTYLYDTTCANADYARNGFQIPADSLPDQGIYTQSAFRQAVTGCDSLVFLTLYIIPAQTSAFDAVACDSYRWRDSLYTATGDYNQIFTATNGCDSIVTLHLTVNPVYDMVDSVAICESELPYYYATGDTTFAIGTPSYSTSSFLLHTAAGCDSVVTLHLTINPIYSVQDTLIICETDLPYYYLSADTTFDVGTHSLSIFNFQLSTFHGCDSNVTLHLVVNATLRDTLRDTICLGEPYYANGFNIISDSTQIAGILVETRQTISLQTNCDSLTTLLLTVMPLPEVAVSSSDTAICLGDSVILTAEGNVVYVPHPMPVIVGDILCTDSSIVKPADFVGSGKTAMGIVFYVDSTGEHGWSVALHDACTGCLWGPYSEYGLYTHNDSIQGLVTTLNPRVAINDLNGLNNTQIIENYYDSLFVACQAAHSVCFYNHLTNAVDTARYGWYLPAAGQLNFLYSQLNPVNVSLVVAGGTPFADNHRWWYWTSTEAANNYSWYLSSSGGVSAIGKNVVLDYLKARGIRDF